jgi:serine/threonine-protein kinase
MNQDLLPLFLQACAASSAPGLRVDGEGTTTVRSLAWPFAVIGREPTMDIRLDGPEVGRRHAYVQLIDGRLFCVDLKSRSGTYWADGPRKAGWVDAEQGIRIGPWTLRPSDTGGPTSPCQSDDNNPLQYRRRRGAGRSRVILEFFRGSKHLQNWRLAPVLTLVGRSSDCRIRLDDPSLARIHCGLLRTGLGTWIVDLMGKNGTCHNGNLIRWAQLADGDLLHIGMFAIRVHFQHRHQSQDGPRTVVEKTDTPESGLSEASGQERAASLPGKQTGSYSTSTFRVGETGEAVFAPVTSRDEFVDRLGETGLLNADQWDHLTTQLLSQFDDLRGLARELLNRNWLTAFQINQIVRRQGNRLVVGPYVVLERLGKGGMGQVFKAQHRFLNRLVALKVIRKKLFSSAEARQRFEQEIHLAAQLSHPHVVLAYDGGMAAGVPYLAMEYVEGTSLGKLVERTGPLPVQQACDFIRQAASGLQHGYKRGLVHRDIKPSNLLLQTHGSVVKVADWGLARLRDLENPHQDRRLTRIGKTVGTCGFLAPEQGLNSRQADIRADLYSLGCTFYYLVTGQLPFPLERKLSEYLDQARKEPLPLAQLCPDLPDTVTQIIRKLMALLPEDRYQTPAELADALEPLVALPVQPAASAVAGGQQAEPNVAPVGPEPGPARDAASGC